MGGMGSRGPYGDMFETDDMDTEGEHVMLAWLLQILTGGCAFAGVCMPQLSRAVAWRAHGMVLRPPIEEKQRGIILSRGW